MIGTIADLAKRVSELELDSQRMAAANAATSLELMQWRYRARKNGDLVAQYVHANNSLAAQVVQRTKDYDELVFEVRNLLPDVGQLLDGWHADGTAWSQWDETVRQRVGALLQRIHPP